MNRATAAAALAFAATAVTTPQGATLPGTINKRDIQDELRRPPGYTAIVDCRTGTTSSTSTATCFLTSVSGDLGAAAARSSAQKRPWRKSASPKQQGLASGWTHPRTRVRSRRKSTTEHDRLETRAGSTAYSHHCAGGDHDWSMDNRRFEPGAVAASRARGQGARGETEIAVVQAGPFPVCEQEQECPRLDERDTTAAASAKDDALLRPQPFSDAGGGNSMITRVQVDNLAMVDSVQVQLGRGLIAITGETGAGKSLISSAFSLAAGARVRGTDLVGAKGPTARVQLDLELEGEHRKMTKEVLSRVGVPLTDDGRSLSVTRTVGGKGFPATINGCAVKVATLRELMSPLIYTVDANAFEMFSRAEGRLRTLDRMLSPPELALADRVKAVVAELRQAEACRMRLEQRCRFDGGQGEDEEDTSLLHHWVEELDEFRQSELRFMTKMRSVVDAFVADWGEDTLGPLAEPLLSATTSTSHDHGGFSSSSSSSSGDTEGSFGGVSEEEGLSDLWPRLSRIREGMQDVEASRTKVELARQTAVDSANPESIAHALCKIRDLLIDAEQENVGLSQELLEDTHEDLNSLEDCLKRAGDKLDASVQSLPILPITLEEVEERTTGWRDLARKHGVPPERLGMMQSQLRVELDELVVAAEALPLARERENSWRVLAERLAGQLSTARRRAASEVEDLINPMMADVGLEGVTVKVVVEESKTLGNAGWDKAQFGMEANDGQTRGTVDAVASSGEKSRLLLLLETRLPPPAQSPSNVRRLHGANGNALDDDQHQGNTLEYDRCQGEDGLASQADMWSHEELEGVAVQSWNAVAGGGGRDISGGGRGFEWEGRAAPCAVLYDEIDAHVGGRTAVAVGRLLANQGRDSQVVVVTHTASVAALADQHLVVDKKSSTTIATATSEAEEGDSADTDDRMVSTGTTTRTTGLEKDNVHLDDDEDDDENEELLVEASSMDWRSRHDISHARGRISVAIKEVKEREREREVARMAAGDIGGGAADELARALLRSGRRRLRAGLSNAEGT